MRKTSNTPFIGAVIVGGIFDGYIYSAQKPTGAVILTREEGERLTISSLSWKNLPDFDFAAPIPPLKVGDRVKPTVNQGQQHLQGTVKFIDRKIAQGVVVQWDSVPTRLNVWFENTLERINDC